MLSNTIHIVCASDDNYIMPASVMLCSLFENNLKNNIVIHFLGTSLRDESIHIISQLVSKYNQEVVFYNIIPEEYNEAFSVILKEGNVPSHISLSTFNRLFITDILPETLDKCIYIDVDTIVTSSLEELWAEPLDNKSIGWCLDGQYKNKNSNRMGLVSYCNAGVLLINLSKWREIHIIDRFIKYISENISNLPYADQDVLNYIFQNDQKILNPKYNVMIYYYMNEPYFSDFVREDYKTLARNAVKDPIIIHYVSGVKPWHKECDHPMTNEWRKYLSLTNWNGIKLSYKKSYFQRIKEKSLEYLKQVARLIPSIRKNHPSQKYINY